MKGHILIRKLQRTKNAIPSEGKSFADVNKMQSLKWDYYHNNKEGLLTPYDYMPNSNQKAWFTCGKLGHKPFICSIKDMNNGKTGYCRMCYHNINVGINDLQSTQTELIIKEWDSNANINDGIGYAFQYLPGSHVKAHWRCYECHEPFITPIRSHVKTGLGCSKCNHANKELIRRAKKQVANVSENAITCDRIPKIVKLWDYSRNALTPDYYSINSSIRVWFHCDNPLHDSWITSINSMMSYDTGCPQCAHRKAAYDTSFAYVNPLAAGWWDYFMNSYENIGSPDDYLPNSKKQAWFKCPYGHVFKTRISTINATLSCVECKHELLAKNNIMITYPELCMEWDYNLNGNLKPEQFTEGSRMRIWWHCSNPRHNSFMQSIVSRTHHHNKCPQCTHRKASSDYNLAVICPDMLSEWDYELNENTPDAYTPYSNRKAHWKCDNGHKWIASIKERTSHTKTGCPYCSHIVSNSENELADAIISMMPELADEIRSNRNRRFIKFHDDNNNEIGNMKEIDILIPSAHVGIEFNGIVWHSNDYIMKSKGMSSYEYHKQKYDEALKLGYKIAYIWEDDWNANRDELMTALHSFITTGVLDGILHRFTLE